MGKKHEKDMLDLQRLLKTQKFEGIEEAQAFMQKHVVGKPIPTFDKEALTPEEQAQDLVYQAIETEDVTESDKLVFLALQHDPDCAEAYEYLGDVAGSPMASLLLYKNGYMVARKKLGDKFFKENKGHFWGIHETRPFMRCLKNYAECLYVLGQKESALTAFFELLELNPNDNQGIRDEAGIYCLELGKLDHFEKLNKEYEDDPLAFHHFNYALFCFMKYGDTEASRTALTRAREANKHVINLMLSKKELPMLPDHYGIGDKNEAIYYVVIAKEVWLSISGTMVWLEKIYYKR